MALVPRTLEARGLDAAPPMQAKLGRAGDLRAVEILDVILRDEVGHVAIGNHWYRWLCARQNTKRVVDFLKGCSPPLVSYKRGMNRPGFAGGRLV